MTRRWGLLSHACTKCSQAADHVCVLRLQTRTFITLICTVCMQLIILRYSMYVDVLTQVVPTVDCTDETLPALPTAGENSGIKLCSWNNSEQSNGQNIHVAVLGRNRILFSCAIRPCYHVRSTVVQNSIKGGENEEGRWISTQDCHKYYSITCVFEEHIYQL